MSGTAKTDLAPRRHGLARELSAQPLGLFRQDDLPAERCSSERSRAAAETASDDSDVGPQLLRSRLCTSKCSHLGSALPVDEEAPCSSPSLPVELRVTVLLAGGPGRIGIYGPPNHRLTIGTAGARRTER